MSGSTEQQPASKRTKRTNGEGSIYLNGDRWRGAIIWTDPNGVQHRKTFAAKLQGTVKDRMAAFRRDLEANAGVIPKGTTGEYLTRWLATARQDIRPATWRQRDTMVRSHIIPAIGAVKLARLTPGDIERMTAAMIAAGKSPTTAVGARVVLRRALRDAQRDGKVRQNAAALARPPRMERRELEYLNAAQLRRLLDITVDHVLGPVVAVAATTGLRQGELLGLRWQDVDLEAGSLTVRRTSSPRPRRSHSSTVDGERPAARAATERRLPALTAASSTSPAPSASRVGRPGRRLRATPPSADSGVTVVTVRCRVSAVAVTIARRARAERLRRLRPRRMAAAPVVDRGTVSPSVTRRSGSSVTGRPTAMAHEDGNDWSVHIAAAILHPVGERVEAQPDGTLPPTEEVVDGRDTVPTWL